MSIHWFQFIKDNPDKDWDWESICCNENLTWEIIQQNPDKEWDWNNISYNKNITWEIIQQNPDKPWVWRYISENPNITCEFIQNNPDKPWRWERVTKNTMKLGKEPWISQRRLKHIKVFQIQRHWRNCSCNPEFKLAQRCLLRLHSS